MCNGAASPTGAPVSGRKRLVVGLLSHYFQDANLGCIALSISNVALMDEVARQQEIDLEYRILVNEKTPKVAPNHSVTPYEYRVFDSSKRTLRHPLRYLRSEVFDGCDIVVNINAGDGFTDLYSFKRMISESYMMLLAHRKKKPTVMAPQTIGPFKRSASRSIARRVLGGCSTVFARDHLSTELTASLVHRANVVEVVDVAFALPYAKAPLPPLDGEALHVGINVSGLLYRGGYDGKNYFDLAVDYKDFVHSLVRDVQERGHRVHLIAHVIAEPGSVEDDYSACQEVATHFPDAVVAPRFDDAIAAKSYIAGLDFFSGARMHATIAAFSSGVPVVPIGYSKKLNGLYGTLGYSYYLDIRDSRWTVESAVKQMLDWLERRHDLSAGLAESQPVVAERLQSYRYHMQRIMSAAARVT